MRLIDADALTDELIRESEADTSKSIQTSFAKSVCLLLCKALELQQTVDAVPVIRCKDCKYNSNTEGNYVNCDIIPQMFGKTPDYNYCSWAEPKEADG